MSVDDARKLVAKRQRKVKVRKRQLKGAQRWLEKAKQTLAKRKAELELWGGSRRVTQEVIDIVNGRARVTSRKRTETFGNPGSDHHTSQKTADAVDFGIAEAHWLKNEIARKLTNGALQQVADFQNFTVRRGGHTYRVQMIAATHGTGPHLHVGVRRV
jgi:hypothetical protein